MVPVAQMDTWMVKYGSWRNFILNSYHQRLNELLTTIDLVAFSNMDTRLWDYLIKKRQFSGNSILEVTHQQIAIDLHSSRVVISRLLKKLENSKKVKLTRNHIELLSYEI